MKTNAGNEAELNGSNFSKKNHTHNKVSITTFKLLNNELWWGGSVCDGAHAPFGKDYFTRDLSSWKELSPNNPEASNQSAPLLLSTQGRYIWSDSPFTFTFNNHSLTICHQGDLFTKKAGTTLAEAYHAVSQEFFPPSNKTIPAELITKLQYNTWIEMPYHPTQKSIEQYAEHILAANLPAGTIMIDDKWCPDYGDWKFDTRSFPNAASMIQKLHNLGFRIMLWLVPFVSPDSENFRYLEQNNLLLRDSDKNTAIRRWWNGFSAVLDISNPQAINWLKKQLNQLINMGIDGFKFDGGDFYEYHNSDIASQAMTSADFCQKWAELGLSYPYNEFRACWKMGGQPLAQRLRDKPQSWDHEGLQSLIPELLTQSMIGHAFTCPDMIGGGEIESMKTTRIDQEFFIRYAQVAALTPMMQFSTLPTRVLDTIHLQALKTTLSIREKYLSIITNLAQHASQSGEPILRPMSYHYPHYEDIIDQFLLGADIIVAPCLQKGAKYRYVTIPEGTWISDKNTYVSGPARIKVTTPLDRLPRFIKVKNDQTE